MYLYQPHLKPLVFLYTTYPFEVPSPFFKGFYLIPSPLVFFYTTYPYEVPCFFYIQVPTPFEALDFLDIQVPTPFESPFLFF